MSDQLTLFAGDTHASHFPQPGDEKARRMTATSGRNLIGSWLNSGPLGSLEKTLLGTSAWASTMCFLTWRDKVTPQGRLLFQLAPLTPRTEETGFGLLPTARASSAMGESLENVRQRAVYKSRLEERIALLPTPRSCSAMAAPNIGNRVNDKNLNLESAVAHLSPTPQASDNRDRASLDNPSVQRRLSIGKQISLSQLWAGRLNPQFVEQMMGFPTGWTDLSHSETP